MEERTRMPIKANNWNIKKYAPESAQQTEKPRAAGGGNTIKAVYTLKTADGQRHELCISWTGNMYNGDALTVTFDEEAIGVIPNERALWAGREFCLSDGSVLRFEMAMGALCISWNGKMLRKHELCGCALSDASAIRLAGRLIRCSGLYMIIEGLLRIGLLNSINVSIVCCLVLGAALMVLGTVAYSLSKIALISAIACFLLHTILFIIIMIRLTILALGAVLLYFGLTVSLIRGLFALGRLNRRISAH